MSQKTRHSKEELLTEQSSLDCNETAMGAICDYIAQKLNHSYDGWR